jgi:hypothetical protein
VVIKGGWLFDGVSDIRVRNSGIVVRNGKFIEVGADLSGRDLSAAYVIDVSDNETILPGMFDVHGHYSMDLLLQGRVEEVTYNPLIYLANGVTSTYTCGEFDPEEVIEARRRIDSGEQIGPRIFNSGPYFGAFRCLGGRTHHDGCEEWAKDMTPQQLRKDVDFWAERGIRGVKIKLASPEELRVVIDQAHKHGLTVTGHLFNYEGYNDVDPKDAILMGIDRIEHTVVPPDLIREGNYAVGTPGFEEIVQLFLRHQVVFVPTMACYHRPGFLKNPNLKRTMWVDESKYFTPYIRDLIAERPPFPDRPESPTFKHKLKELKAFYDAGGGHLITVGSDHPIEEPEGARLAGFEVHRELQVMAYAGLPPVAVLKAATINGARALGVGDRLGSIEAGKLADLFVATGNPLEDITHARDVRLVMKAGRVYEPEALLKSAEGKIGPSGPDDAAAWRRQN